MRRSFVTFSWISEVDWASQKATVATSWKGLFSFIECQLNKFEPASKLSFLQHHWLCLILYLEYGHLDGAVPAIKESHQWPRVHRTIWDWTPEIWEFGFGPLRMSIWDRTPENDHLRVDPSQWWRTKFRWNKIYHWRFLHRWKGLGKRFRNQLTKKSAVGGFLRKRRNCIFCSQKQFLR